MTETIIFFDLETGGFSYSHPITQLAAAAVVDGVDRAFFEVKLQFDPEICNPMALELNGYSEQVWRAEAVEPVEALRRFGVFCDTYSPHHPPRLGGQNIAAFDIPFLQRWAIHYEVPLRVSWDRPLDTRRHAVAIGLATPNVKLETLAEHFGLEFQGQQHEALADVHMAVQVARAMAMI